MNIPRFNYERWPGTPSSLRLGKYPHQKWIRITRLGGPVLRDSGRSGRRRIFAIVAPPKVDLSGKAIRDILIFDNHPESLHLISQQHPNSVVDLTASRRTSRSYIIPGLVLGLALRDWNVVVRVVAGVADLDRRDQRIAATAFARKHSLERGSKQRLVGGITKSRRCAMATNQSSSDRET
jgi:hypothetical protein